MKVRQRALLLAAFAVVAAVVGQAALADSPAGVQTDGSRIGGVVPVLANGVPASPEVIQSNLVWHGGNVMRTNKTYAIFWVPPGQTMSSSYKTLIKTYLKDVAAASGLSSNVYFSDTQYFDSRGNIKYSSAFGGATTATNAFPTNGCVDPATVICLSDVQLRAEINQVITSKGWTRTPSHAFFLFTPKDVGSCFGSGPSGCAFTEYCAYHGAEGSGSHMLIYANQPYVGGRSGCDPNQRPNGNDADATLNVVSHEHNEAITDPDVSTGWFDSSGNENGDKCNFTFGPSSGPPGAMFNQTINGHHYYLQMEWSNQGSHCVQTGL